MISRILFLLACGGSIALVLAGLRERLGGILQPRRNDLSFDRLGQRLRRVVTEVLFQRRVMANRPVVGILHAAVMWGFVAFAYITLRHLWLGIVGLDHAAPADTWYHNFAAAWAIVVFLAISGLAFRRFVMRPTVLGALSPTSAVVSGLIMVLMASYLVDWSGAVSPGSVAWKAVWWIHTAALLVFPAVIAKSKHLHLLLSPVTIFFRSETTSRTRPLKLDADGTPEELGMETFADLSVKNILDINACVECARCTVACPANRSGGTLSPKAIILDMQHGLRAGGTTITGTLYDVAHGKAWVHQEDLMQCLACGACEQACPVGIEHVGKIILDLRRGLISNDPSVNERAAATFDKMEHTPHNPWGLPAQTREQFIAQEKFPIFTPDTEVLFWLGCGNSYDPHGQDVARAMRDILDATGISWGVLEHETCCGEPARRMGNEMLYLDLSSKLVATLAKSGATTIVTCCPHCTSVLDGDYRQIPEYEALNIEVLHHTEFLDLIIGLVPLKPASGTVTYHDPCNLTRGRNVTREPRALLNACGMKLQETKEHGHATMCCGAGGGQLFIGDETKEAPGSTRVNVQRFEQLAATGSDTIAVACPYCPIMLSDAAQAAQNSTPIKDVAELIAQRLK